jgi:hypothetical protein
MAQKAAQAPIQNLTSPNPEELRLPVDPSLDSEVQLAEELRQKTELLKLSREAVLVVDLSTRSLLSDELSNSTAGSVPKFGRSPLEFTRPSCVACRQVETILRRSRIGRVN